MDEWSRGVARRDSGLALSNRRACSVGRCLGRRDTRAQAGSLNG